MKDIYVFPATFTYSDDGISIKFPDLPGCLSCADTTEEAISMARDALGVRLYTDERDGDYIPAPSDILELKKSLADNQITVPVDVNMKIVRDSVKLQTVNKMVTIPQWLVTEGKEAGVNFSQVMQEALMEKLGLKQTMSRKRKKS